MIVEDQTATIEFLKDPATHGCAGPVEVIETHISMVFLAGDRAYKLKRAVHLPYADFSTAAIRAATCETEVALNAPTAPGLYLGTRRITRGDDGCLSFDGIGPLADAVVAMVRFEQSDLFDQMAMAGTLTPALMSGLSHTIAAFHRGLPPVHTGSGAANMEGVLNINAAGFATSHVFSEDAVKRFDATFRDALARHAETLDRRERAGMIRRCHGDLHLRNICMFQGQPRLFDCIDFNDQIATIDVLYDLAFLLMDLWHRGHPELASLVANRYFDEIGQDDGFELLPFFMAVRAAVRAHVTATLSEDLAEGAEEAAASARRYFDLALSLLAPCAPGLVAIGGLSGSGKSTVAEALAPRLGRPPGARIVESDRTRKALFGARPEERLPSEAYEPAVSDKVYHRITARALALTGAGSAVIVDAVFDRPDRRGALDAAACAAGVPLTGIWLHSDAATLRSRVATRPAGVSDATPEVLEAQLKRDIGPVTWARIDASRPVEATVAAILALRRETAAPAPG
ncbi:aminoglycoside phosphotransferase [Rhodovulum sp. NI22]|nr:aminoglycoside phosphotransferase [Rhodovulum sp. NI22]